MNTAKLTLGSTEIKDRISNFFLSQLTILRLAVQTKLDEKTEKIKIVLASACNTGSAISELSKKAEYFHGEIIMLSRGFIEKIINAIYLTICPSDEYEKYFKHTIAKSVRKLNRSIKINQHEISLKYSGEIELNNGANIQDALNAFTSINGKEITHWTKLSLEKRIEQIGKETNVNLPIFMLNTLSIYEDASEALHGSLYGCSFFTWAYEPNVDRSSNESLNNYTNSKTTLILWQLGIMIDEVIKLLSKNNSLSKLVEVSQKGVDMTVDIIKPLLSVQKKSDG